ncbi:MAG: hypothetical protein AB7U20_19265 [Planctomycetaceae bacterium]
MSLRQLLILVAVLLTSAAAWDALSADGPAGGAVRETSESRRMQAQLSALEERVKALEDQLTGVRPAAAFALPAPQVSPRIGSDADRVPPTWKQGEINGVRFYTIPLSVQEKGP